MREFVLKGRAIVEGCCKGEALVSLKPLSFLGGVDPASGTIVEKGHDLCGESVRDRILCFPHGHGSTVGSYVLYALAKKGFAPRAIVNEKIDPVVVVGAVIAEIPMIAEVDIQQIATGDIVDVDACSGVVRILKSKR